MYRAILDYIVITRKQRLERAGNESRSALALPSSFLCMSVNAGAFATTYSSGSVGIFYARFRNARTCYTSKEASPYVAAK